MAFLFSAIPRIFSSPLVSTAIGSLATGVFNVVKPIFSDLAGRAVEGIKNLAVDGITSLGQKAINYITGKRSAPPLEESQFELDNSGMITNPDAMMWDDARGVKRGRSSSASRRVPARPLKRLKRA